MIEEAEMSTTDPGEHYRYGGASQPDGGPGSRYPYDPQRKFVAGGNIEVPEETSEYDSGREQLEISMADQISIGNRKVCWTVTLVALVTIIVLWWVKTSASPTSQIPKTPEPNHFSQNGYEHVTDSRGNKYSIVAIYDRAPIHYTQGFYFVDATGQLLESAGYWGKSKIQYLELAEPTSPGTHGTSKVVKATDNSVNEFAEGCTMVNQRGKTWVYQLTWKSRQIFRYNSDLVLDKVFSMPAAMQEGWGLSHNPNNGNEMFATDSGATIFTLSPNAQDTELQLVGQKQIVNENGFAVNSLNELEHTGTTLFSNVYLSSSIQLIDLGNGKVRRSIDMSRLITLATQAYNKTTGRYLDYQQCLNGIAYDKKEDVFYLTGKEWPLIFKIKFPREYYI